MAESGNYKLRLRSSRTFREATIAAADEWGTWLARYTTRSLRLVREIGVLQATSTSSLVLYRENIPLPALKEPPKDDDMVTRFITIPMADKLALDKDCVRTKTTTHSRVLRCLHFTNFLTENRIWYPTIKHSGGLTSFDPTQDPCTIDPNSLQRP